MSFQFFVPALPDRVLSPNRGEVKVIAAVAEERRRMHTEVYFAGLKAQEDRGWKAPKAKRVRVGIVYRCTNKRPKLDTSYRPTDITNAISALKPVYDALHVELDLFPDDKWQHMELGEHRIERVERLEDEGLLITVEEL